MSERPMMSAGFTYDFYMGRHEVICKDFNDVMENATGLTIACEQDSMPAANVTFYDAVLYANALSKERGFDTAYTYASAELDADRHCVRMKSFLFNPASNGFRLPTEAEWVLVARKNWEPYQSWNGDNSGSVAHKVCSSLESKAYFCDMAGNMLELVNDRYVSLADTHVVNFVGALEEDAVGSCVVKGGNYMSAPNSMMHIVVELSPGFMFRHYVDMVWALLYFSPGIQYDKTHLTPETKDEIARLSQEQQFANVLLGQQYIENTFLLPSVGWGVAVVNPDVDISAMSFDASILQDNLKLLQSLKAFADSNGVQLIAAIPPRNPGYTFTEAFDPYGPSNDVAQQIIDAVKGMGILIFDENKNGHHDYTSAMAYNPNHLSYLGAAQFSVRLDAFLKSLP